MKKMVFLAWLIVLLAPMVWAQDKVEAPVWNVGDKWNFSKGGTAKVVGADQNSYIVEFSNCDSMFEKYFDKLILDKISLNILYTLTKGRRDKYTLARRRLLNFPLTVGKQWKDKSTGKPIFNPTAPQTDLDYEEIFSVLGWEDVKIQAGKFKTLKLEFYQRVIGRARSGTAFFWYSPEVKYFVKCQLDTTYWKILEDWEVTSFQLKK
jgi:hypothetical protein